MQLERLLAENFQKAEIVHTGRLEQPRVEEGLARAQYGLPVDIVLVMLKGLIANPDGSH